MQKQEAVVSRSTCVHQRVVAPDNHTRHHRGLVYFTKQEQITEKGRYAEDIIQVKSIAAVRWLLGGLD